MLIKTLVVGQIGTNCYIVTDENTLKSVVLDPGDESGAILDYIEANKLTVEAIFLTHGHFDHNLAVYPLREATGAPIYIHKKDAVTADARDQFKLTADENVRYYKEGDVLAVGGMTFTVLETPGHSPGSVTLLSGNALFTGDTLFKGSMGRTDLGEGNQETLMRSLKRLYQLDGDFEVYPGHMGSTTLDRERRFNDFLKYAGEDSGIL